MKITNELIVRFLQAIFYIAVILSTTAVCGVILIIYSQSLVQGSIGTGVGLVLSLFLAWKFPLS